MNPIQPTAEQREAAERLVKNIGCNNCQGFSDPKSVEAVSKALALASYSASQSVQESLEAYYSERREECICESDEEDCVDCRPYSLMLEVARRACEKFPKPNAAERVGGEK